MKTQLLGIVLLTIATACVNRSNDSQPANADKSQITVDAEIRERLSKEGTVIKILGHTRDLCDRAEDVTILHTADGDIKLAIVDEKYFKLDLNRETRWSLGTWRWRCGVSLESSRIRGAELIRAMRGERGIIDWFAVSLSQ